MANTLSSPNFVSDQAREGVVLSYNATLIASPSVANPILRIKNGATTLVDFLLHATVPFLGGTVDGSSTLQFVSASAVATGGTATTPNAYQIIGRDGLTHLSGVIAAATDAISTGQTVSAGTITITAPQS